MTDSDENATVVHLLGRLRGLMLEQTKLIDRMSVRSHLQESRRLAADEIMIAQLRESLRRLVETCQRLGLDDDPDALIAITGARRMLGAGEEEAASERLL